MPRRPDISILLITDREVVRGDFAAGREPRLVDLWRRERPVDGGLAVAAELAIGLGPKVARRVLLLTTAAWTQTVLVPSTSVANMAGDELDQTLKFEVESFSGLAAFESQLAQAEVNASGTADREFWITQLSSGELSAVQEVVAARGGRLIGVCHPAGLPAPLKERQPWQRLEFWPGAVCCVSGDQGRRMFVSHGDPRSDRWQTSLQNWESRGGSAATSEWLVGPGVVVALEHLGESVLRLDEQPSLEHWLNGWAGMLSRGECNVPLLRPARKPVARQTKALCSVAALAVAMAVCISLGSYLRAASDQVRQEIEALKKPNKEKQQYEQQAAAIQRERQELEQQLAKADGELRAVEPMVVFQRRRLAMLLQSLATASRAELVIRGIKCDEHGVTVSGMSLVADAANELADALNDDLQSAGWQARPPDQTGTNQLANGGPWSFSILLEEMPPPTTPQDDAENRVAATAVKHNARQPQ